MPDPAQTAPEAWVDAYDAWAMWPEGSAPQPRTVTFAQADLSPEMAREILKLFQPEADV